LTIWNLLEQSQTMNQQISNICGIRFYLRIERFTIQIFLTQSIINNPWTRYKTIYNFKPNLYDSKPNYQEKIQYTWNWIIEWVLQLIDPSKIDLT